MPVRSKRLFGPVGSGGAGVVLYTAPASETTIVKQLHLTNNAALAQTFALYLNGSGGGQIIDSGSVPATGTLIRQEWFLVLQPGDNLRVLAGGAGLGVVAFGAELEGVAD